MECEEARAVGDDRKRAAVLARGVVAGDDQHEWLASHLGGDEKPTTGLERADGAHDAADVPCGVAHLDRLVHLESELEGIMQRASSVMHCGLGVRR